MRITKEVVKVISDLEDRKGRLTPEQIVHEAEKEDSPLHSFFEWDNDIAAEAHRIEQARDLIKRVKIVVEVQEKNVRTVAYVRDTEKGKSEAGYVSLLKVNTRQAKDIMASELERILELLDRAIKLSTVTQTDLPAGISSKLESIKSKVSELKSTL